MPLEENTSDENNIKQGKNTTGAIVKHQVIDSGVAYALPDKERAENGPTKNPANVRHIVTQGGTEYALPNKADTQEPDEYQNGGNYMELNEIGQDGTADRQTSILRHHSDNILTRGLTQTSDGDGDYAQLEEMTSHHDRTNRQPFLVQGSTVEIRKMI